MDEKKDRYMVLHYIDDEEDKLLDIIGKLCRVVHRRASHLDKKDQKIMRDAKKVFDNYIVQGDRTWWITGEFTEDISTARTAKRRPQK